MKNGANPKHTYQGGRFAPFRAVCTVVPGSAALTLVQADSSIWAKSTYDMSKALCPFAVIPYAGMWIETSKSPRISTNGGVIPYAGMWIETWDHGYHGHGHRVIPYAGMWIETVEVLGNGFVRIVIPYAGMWIETMLGFRRILIGIVIPYAGMWIETLMSALVAMPLKSFPTREYGLKQPQKADVV